MLPPATRTSPPGQNPSGPHATADQPRPRAHSAGRTDRYGRGHGAVAARCQGRPRAGRPRPSCAVHQRQRVAGLLQTVSHRRGVAPVRRGVDRPAGGGLSQRRAAPGPRRARVPARGTSRGARCSPRGLTGFPGPCRDPAGPDTGPDTGAGAVAAGGAGRRPLAGGVAPHPVVGMPEHRHRPPMARLQARREALVAARPGDGHRDGGAAAGSRRPRVRAYPCRGPDQSRGRRALLERHLSGDRSTPD